MQHFTCSFKHLFLFNITLMAPSASCPRTLWQTGPALPPELQPSLRTLQKPVGIFRRRSDFKHEDWSFKIKMSDFLKLWERQTLLPQMFWCRHHHRAAADVRRPSECSELILILTEHWDIELSNSTRVAFRRCPHAITPAAAWAGDADASTPFPPNSEPITWTLQQKSRLVSAGNVFWLSVWQQWPSASASTCCAAMKQFIYLTFEGEKRSQWRRCGLTRAALFVSANRDRGCKYVLRDDRSHLRFHRCSTLVVVEIKWGAHHRAENTHEVSSTGWWQLKYS